MAVCHKVNHNIGIVRVSAYVLVPIIITLVVMMAYAPTHSQEPKLSTSRIAAHLPPTGTHRVHDAHACCD